MSGDFLPSRGHASSLIMTIERELTADDLVRLASEDGGAHDYVPAVKRLTSRHQRQAQLVAEGYKIAEVAALTQSTPARITQLQRDPSFANLVAYYADQRMVTQLEAGERIRQKLVIAGEEAVDEIVARVEDPVRRAAMPIDQLRQVAALALDRTVAPPKVSQPLTSIPTNITLNFGRELKPQEPKDITPSAPQPTTIEAMPDASSKDD